jgi:hypothetical protein
VSARDQIRPASPADAVLAQAFAAHDETMLATCETALPPPLAMAVRRHFAETPEAETTHKLGRELAGAGWCASAMTALRVAAEQVPIPTQRIPLYDDMAVLERALGLDAAANGHLRRCRRLAGEGNPTDTLPNLETEALAVIGTFSAPDFHRSLCAAPGAAALHDDPLRDPGFTKAAFHACALKPLLGGIEDFSFVIINQRTEQPVLMVECDILGDRYLGCREAGIDLTRVGCESALTADARDLAVSQLEIIANWAGANHIVFDLPTTAPLPFAVQDRCSQKLGVDVFASRHAWIELSPEMADIKGHYRASTRQRVRWGRENMTVMHHSECWDHFGSYYLEANDMADRMAPLPIAVVMDFLQQGLLDGFVGFYQGALSSLVLTSRHGDTTYDMATSRRSGCKDPVTHVLIDAAIQRAKNQGQRRFHFGNLGEGEHFSGKERAIAEFKRGFCTVFDDRLNIHYAV